MKSKNTNESLEELVSIITPAYNAENTIRETIQSVIDQDYKNWEMLIVNDSSSDRTMEMVNEFSMQDSRIKLINLKNNSGISVARNTGIKNAKGRYLAFLDSDDLWKPQKLTKQIAFMQENGYAFSYTAYELMDAKGKPLNKVISVPKSVTYKGLLTQNVIGCLSVMIDRNVIPKVEMPSLKHEDYATWLNVLKKGHIAYGLDENLAFYRKSEGSVSANKFQTISWVWNIHRNNQGMNVIKTSFYVGAFMIKSFAKYFRLGLMKEVLSSRKRA